MKLAEKEKKPTLEGAAGEPRLYTHPPELDKPEAEPAEAEEPAELSRAPIIRWTEPPPAPVGIRPLEPLEPITDADYADRIGDALDPSRIIQPLPEMGVTAEPEAARLRGFAGRSVEALRFTCPYGLGGQCCGCRYMPCNELTLAVLGRVSKDYGPGGRCSAD